MKTDKTGKPKKPLFKRWWFWVLILLIVAAGARGGAGREQAAPAPTAAPAATTSADPAPAPAEPDAAAALVFALNSAEPGEYGRQITLNAGTANESSFYGFYIPAGEYTASNMDQKSAVQLTFCKDGTAVNTDGVEEIIPAEQRPLVLMGGQSGTFALAAGEYVKLSDDSGSVLFEQAAASAYSADPDSLSALLNTVVENPADVSIAKDSAGWIVNYRPTASFWDETDFLKKNLSAYIDFCRSAYEIDGIDSVLFYVSTETTDSRGNKGINGVFNISMPKEKFLAYNWDNMRLKENSLSQIQADCDVFWILPGVLEGAKQDKIFYS